MDIIDWIGIILLLYVFALLSNPQRSITISRRSFTSYKYSNHRLRYKFHKKPKPLPPYWVFVAWIRESFLILFRRSFIQHFIVTKLSFDEIYRSICKSRFNPSSPYLTSGDHFSSFYPRNLGIFYSSALNPTTSCDLADYKNRIAIYLNSLSFALEFYEGHELTTTIIPVFNKYFFPSNIYKKPVDTLLSILISFDLLINPQNHYSTKEHIVFEEQLSGRYLAHELLSKHKKRLKELTFDLLAHLNQRTGLVNEKLSLSGVRDGLLRNGSLYENSAIYKTVKLALELEIIDKLDLAQYEYPENIKNQIIKTYYKEGKWKESINNNSISADCLCLWEFGVLDRDDEKLIVLVNQLQELITPHGILYSNHSDYKIFWVVKYFAPIYMTKTVWSHWTTEYLDLIFEIKDKLPNEYYTKCQEIIINIRQKCVEYQGYPELYRENGQIYKNIFYSSILKTGWIVNFVHQINKYKL